MLRTFLAVDSRALLWINSHHAWPLDAILLPIAYSGEVAMLWFVVSLALLIFGKREQKITGLVLLVSIIAVDRLIAGPIGRECFRTRPYLALEGVRQLGFRWTGTSFPSGHAHSVWVAALVLGDRWRKLSLPLVVFALLTCYSRPYFGMHYPLDTVAGAVLGMVSGLLIVSGRHAWERRRILRTAPTPTE